MNKKSRKGTPSRTFQLLFFGLEMLPPVEHQRGLTTNRTAQAKPFC
jgi:hypothetical protein